MSSQLKLAGAVVVLSGLTFAGAVHPASAQSTSGPIAATEADPAVTKVVPRKKDRAGSRSSSLSSRKKSQSKQSAEGTPDAAKAPQPWMAVDPSRAAQAAGDTPLPAEPKSVVSHMGTNQPLEIGGKWSGSNDTAEKTRTDNYNANAVGTGGEVGLKLHF